MFIELFTEAFDNPYKFKKSIDFSHFTQYEFATDDDVVYLVTLTRPDTSQGDYMPYTSLSFETDYGEMHITGDGDAFRVFATVLAIIKKEKSKLKSHGSFRFASDSDEHSRMKLYKVMAKKLNKLLKYKKLETKTGGGQMVFYFFDDSIKKIK